MCVLSCKALVVSVGYSKANSYCCLLYYTESITLHYSTPRDSPAAHILLILYLEFPRDFSAIRIIILCIYHTYVSIIVRTALLS